MSVYLSPLFGAGAQLFDAQGRVLNGGFINTFQAGSTTPIATYVDNTQTTQNAVAIQLDSAGRPPNEIWLLGGQGYKFTVTNSVGVQQGPVFDNIMGVNDSSGSGGGGGSLTVWTTVAGTPTFIGAAQFSIPGNLTTTFPVGTRVKSTVTAGTAYGVVSAVSFGSFTTVTLINDGTTLDSGLSLVAVSANSVIGPNMGAAAVSYNSTIVNPAGSVGADLVAKATIAATTTTNLNAVSKAVLLAGGTTAFTLTPVPAIGSYVQGQTWLVQANVASSGTTTINISGQGVKNLKQLNSGNKVNATLVLNAIYELAFDGTDVMVMNATAGSGKLLRITNFNAGGTWTRGSDVNSVMAELVGGGGGGGIGPLGGGGGGGGGGYAKVYVSAPGATETVTVGAGGVGSVSPTAGGVSSFGTWASATGGVVTSGAGGVGTVGDVLLVGGAGNGTDSGGSVLGGGLVSQSGTLGVAAPANSGIGGGLGTVPTGGSGGSGRVIVYEYG